MFPVYQHFLSTYKEGRACLGSGNPERRIYMDPVQAMVRAATRSLPPSQTPETQSEGDEMRTSFPVPQTSSFMPEFPLVD